jgi:hypothetical protein
MGLMAVGVILVGATSVFAQDWPQWRGANRDGKVTGFTAPATWPQELKQGWKVTVVAGNRIFVKDQDTLALWTLE